MTTAIRLLWDGTGSGSVEPESSDHPIKTNLVTVFVGGFNNTDHRQSEAFGKVWKRLKRLVARQRFRGKLLYFFWPSAAGPWRPVGLLRYRSRVLVAEDAGRALGQYLLWLRAKNPRQEAQLIGHSLGCRVVLAAASELENAGAEVPRLLLMAAAVPESECAHGGRYDLPSGNPDRTVVLWSDQDKDLGYWWVKGEKAALRKSGRRPPAHVLTAVGRYGGPAGRWSGGPRKSCGLQHTEYWNRDESLCHVAELVGTPLERQEFERRFPEATFSVREQLSREFRKRD